MAFNGFDQLIALQTAFQSITMNSVVPFDLKNLKDNDFPYDEYYQNLTKYQEAVSWFTGDALKPEENKDVNYEPYPIRINPITNTCLKHGYALFGEYNNDSRPLVIPRMVLDEPESQRELARHAEKTLNFLWWESFGRSLMLENGITSQIFGGSIFYIRYVPWETWRKIPFRIERVNPDSFIGTPVYGDQYRLQEAWIVKNIRAKDAAFYGVNIDNGQPAYWIEHWEQDKFKITINGKPISYQKNGMSIKGEDANPWEGMIPMVYIPHIRAGNFYGLNNIDSVRGIVKELNLRFGDFGDAINSDSHSIIAIRNIQGTPRVVRISDGIEALDLGSVAGITGNEPIPDVIEVRKGMASAPMSKMLDQLYDQYRRDAAHPAVADGEDEGSQRSAATLVARMWPMTSHINMERINWTGGLDWLSSMVLRVMKVKGVGEITDAHLEMRIRQEWSPILPKDREQFINELVTRAANNLGSPEHLLEMTGDVEDIDDEMDKIKDWIEFKAEANRKSTGSIDVLSKDPMADPNADQEPRIDKNEDKNPKIDPKEQPKNVNKSD